MLKIIEGWFPLKAGQARDYRFPIYIYGDAQTHHESFLVTNIIITIECIHQTVFLDIFEDRISNFCSHAFVFAPIALGPVFNESLGDSTTPRYQDHPQTPPVGASKVGEMIYFIL